MQNPRFSLRTLIIFTSLAGGFFALNNIPWPQRDVLSIGRLSRERQCYKLPYTVRYGLPFTARTDNRADHEPHQTGLCKFRSTYHATGLTGNVLFALVSSATLIGAIIYVPEFAAWGAFLRRERKMIDAAIDRQ